MAAMRVISGGCVFGRPAWRTALSCLAIGTLMLACGEVPVQHLFTTEDWRTVFPAQVKEMTVGAAGEPDNSQAQPTLAVPSATPSAVAVYDCTASCSIVVKGLKCRLPHNEEPSCSVRMSREHCWIGRRPVTDGAVVDVSCHSDSAVEHIEQAKAVR